MDLSQLERPGFDPCSAAWTWLYINHFPRRSGQEEAVPVRREWLERAGLASTAGLWLSYMPEGEGREGDQPGIAAPGEMIVCRNALGLEEKKPYLFYCEGQMRAGLYHLIDGQRVFMPGRTGTEIAVGDDIILVGEIMGSLGVKGVK